MSSQTHQAPDINCDWCREPIKLLRASSGKMILERVIFRGVTPGDGGSVQVHVRCAKHLHERGVQVQKYILASSSDFPLRPGSTPTMRTLTVHFTAEQWSRLQDCAEWMGMTPDKYLAYMSAKGIVDPGRRWSLDNDRRVTPEEKNKTAAIPLVLEDADKRGEVARAIKRAVSLPPSTTTRPESRDDVVQKYENLKTQGKEIQDKVLAMFTTRKDG